MQGGGDQDEQLGYELDEWDPAARVLLDGVLTNAGIAHAWEGSTLVVRAADEAAVDAHLDEVEGARPDGSDDEGDELVYDVSDWTDDQRRRLSQLLDQETVAHAWDDEGGLIVDDADEERVERLLDAVEYPDALPADDAVEGDGLIAQDAMSELFVTADRLMHDPRDHEAVLSLVDAARLTDSLDLPYGFDPAVWDEIAAKAGGLRHALEAAEVDDDDVIDLATALRQLLRPYV